MVSSDRIQVTLTGGAPWGFRLSGGGGMPLVINKIRKKSQAHVQGLKEGDAVISINGVHVHDRSQDEALELVEATGDSLVLEIFRGDKNGTDQSKSQKTIPVLPVQGAPRGTIRLLTTSDDGVSPGEVILIPSGDSVTSESLGTADVNRAQPSVKPGLPVARLISVSSPGRLVTASDSHVITSANVTVVQRSPVVASEVRPRDSHSATSVPHVAAKPFYVTQAGSDSPPYFQPSQTQPAPQPPPPPPPVGPRPQTSVTTPQTYTPLQPPRFSSQPPQAPPPPPVSPKPKRYLSPQPPGLVATSTFDDGHVHREVTREQHVQQSPDGSSSTLVQREVTTTTGRPSFVKSQASAFNTVLPPDVAQPTHKSVKTTTTTRKSTTSIISQKGPTPFISSSPSNILQPQYQPGPAVGYSAIESQVTRTETPLFKPTKFVPGSGKKEVPGPFTPTSPKPGLNAQCTYTDGKENVSPQPMFQVKNIVLNKNTATEVWRPNMWLPGQQPATPQEQPQTVTAREDLPVGQPKPGYSFIEEQKRKLMALQAPKNDHTDAHNQEHVDHHEGHHKHERLHIFAPPVEIHADDDSPYPAHDDQFYMDDDEDGASSPDSFGTRRKKKLYSDSAFYDTPGKSYPTITEQMKLCKKIAQSLTSAANKRARGAKMFMKRKRKSSKWIHEGHSERSSSAGDVANIHELDSELTPDEGGNKPLLYFKIPSIKQRVGNDAKHTKMALTQEQFEKLRLSSKKCDHKSLAPDPCFDIVADLKAHKGKGGRLFERRKQRSDKFVIDETNAKFPLPHGKFDNMSQSGDHHLDPRDVALKHGWKGDPLSSQNLPLPVVVAVRTSLKSEESPTLLKGANFNRLAKGWAGGNEYPVAENLRHISPTRQLGRPQPTSSTSQQEYQQKQQIQQQQIQQQQIQQQQIQQQSYNQVRAWPGAGESRSAPGSFQAWQRDQAEPRQQERGRDHHQQQQQWRRQDNFRQVGWGQEQRQHEQQTPRPKSWQGGSYDTQQPRHGYTQQYPTVDYRYPSGDYPTLAYRQPIIPGTDL